MKTNRIFILLAAALIAVTLFGCEDLLNGLGGGDTVLPLTIEQRIAAFTDDLNADPRVPTEILTNFGPEADMEYYVTAQAESYWEDAFPSANTYAFTVGSTADLTAAPVGGYLTIPVDGELTTTGTITMDYEFTMYQEADSNWLIFSITEDPSGTSETLIRTVNF